MSNPVLAREFEKPQAQYADEVMMAEGVSRRTFILFGLLLAAAVVGWTQVDVGTPPSWMSSCAAARASSPISQCPVW